MTSEAWILLAGTLTTILTGMLTLAFWLGGKIRALEVSTGRLNRSVRRLWRRVDETQLRAAEV